MSDSDTVTLSKDDLANLVAEQVSAQLAEAQKPVNDTMSKVLDALQARPPARPAADVDAGAPLQRTRGTIVVAPATAYAAAVAAAFTGFNYRAFLAAAKPYAKYLDLCCVRYGYSQLDAFVQIAHESAFNPLATSDAGAIGLCQIMPDTAKDWGVDPTDPDASIRALVLHMMQYRTAYGIAIKKGDYRSTGDPMQDSFVALDLALAAYDAGPAAVETSHGVPPYPETVNYVNVIGGTVRGILSNQASRMQWIEDWNALKR